VSLYVGNKAVMTYGEFRQLAESLPIGWSNPALTKFALGLPVDESEFRNALNVSARLAATSDDAHALINRVLSRL
jgi:hypothetical protein